MQIGEVESVAFGVFLERREMVGDPGVRLEAMGAELDDVPPSLAGFR